MRYWLTQGDGKTYGPYGLEQLRELSQQGRFHHDSQLCAEGSQQWVPVSSVISADPPGAPLPPPLPIPPPPPFAGTTPPGPVATAEGAQKSRLAAGLFGIFLGAFGVHNFYLGFTGKGVALLLITVLSVGYLSCFSWGWGLVEGILILTGSIKADARGVPLKD